MTFHQYSEVKLCEAIAIIILNPKRPGPGPPATAAGVAIDIAVVPVVLTGTTPASAAEAWLVPWGTLPSKYRSNVKNENKPYVSYFKSKSCFFCFVVSHIILTTQQRILIRHDHALPAVQLLLPCSCGPYIPQLELKVSHSRD